MKYISARYQENPTQPSDPSIVATGDDGQVYFIPSMDCDVPPWPEYLAEGGTVTALEEVQPPSTYPPPEAKPAPEDPEVT